MKKDIMNTKLVNDTSVNDTCVIDNSTKDGASADNVSADESGAQAKPEHNAVSACQKELQELNEKFLRVSADLHNIHARTAKERAIWAQDIQINFFKELLPIVDDFERALVQEHKQNNQGFELIHKKLNKFLHVYGVSEIDCTGMFDPQFHEALVHVADQNKKSGEIVAVLQKGYCLKDTVIRPARVSVAQ